MSGRFMTGIATVAVAATVGIAPFPLPPVTDPDRRSEPTRDGDSNRSHTQRIPGTDVTFEMVYIPGGEFVMGSPPGEHEYRKDDEGPRMRVEVEPFWMGRFEVTWSEYKRFAEIYEEAARVAQGRDLPAEEFADAVSIPTPPYTMEADVMYPGYRSGPKRPAVNVTQFAAKQYTKWLSRKTGEFYRLPTEAEWEYACRAGTSTAYHFGEDAAMLDEYAWHADNSATEEYPEGTTHPVGQKKPNRWGLHDMHGNAAEWVIDQYAEDWYERQLDGAWAKGRGPLALSWREVIHWPSEEYPRVARGGSWFHFPDELRSAYRIASDPRWKQRDPELPRSIWWHTDAPFVGFRIVRPVNPPESEEERRRWWGADHRRLKAFLRQWSNRGRQVRVDIPLDEESSEAE